MTSGGEAGFLVAASPLYVLCLRLLLRFSAVAALLLAALATPPAGAETGDVYVHAGANFKPVTIAVTPFAGEEPGDKIGGIVSNDFARSIFLLPVNPTSFPETVTNPDVRPNIDAWKTVNAQFVLTGRVLRPDAGHRDRPVPPVGRFDRGTGRRRTIYDRGGERAPGRAHDRRRGVHAGDRREGLLRFARRLRRRERPEGEAPQAPRRDGHGRGECEDARRRRRGSRRHAAVLAVRPAGRLHVVRRRRPQGHAAQSRDRAAGGGRQLPRHDVRAALFAGRRSRS